MKWIWQTLAPVFSACCPRKPKAKSFAFSYSDEPRPTVTDSIQDTQLGIKKGRQESTFLYNGGACWI